MPNPYDPQSPVKPSFFGGRKSVLDKVNDKVNHAKQQSQSGGILLFGYRSIGKTSIIKKIVDVISKTEDDVPSNALIISRRLSKTTDGIQLYQILNEELIEQVMERKSRIKKLTEGINSVKIFEVELKMDGVEEKSPFQKWKYFTRELKNVDFILIALDDADYLLSDALGELKTIVEESQKVPILIVVSGGSQFEEKLVDDYSPIARIFSGASFNIGKFSLEETKEVLNKPLEEEETKWDDDAIKLIHNITFGYPYLVQCLAYESYTENATIYERDVDKSVENATKIGSAWLAHEIPGASDKDILSFAKMTRSNKEIITSSEITELGIATPYIPRLAKLGVLKKISRGRYLILKSPMIAIYEVLKRGLKY